jgi:molybdate transport system ATP-binding protein
VTLPLIKLDNVDVALDGKLILRDINWSLLPGEHWAILGGNGSGKSTLLKLIRGELWPAPGRGRRVYGFDGDEQTTAVGIKEKIAVVSPELQSRYLQQEWRLNGLQVVHSGFGGGDYVYQHLTPAQRQQTEAIIRLVGAEQFLSRNVQELSTGELRKVLIARALAGAPRILACDEICDGLDPASRAGLLQILDRTARQGTQLLYVTHRAEEMISSITHMLELKAGCIVRQTENRPDAGNTTGSAERTQSGVRPSSGAADSARELIPNSTRASRPRALLRPGRPHSNRKSLISIRGASVFLGPKPVLLHIHLDIRTGEHWAILGPNGAGKSTLLKLMLGDLHPAWGGRVQRFEFTAKNTLWEVKRKIGFISPELQSNYREPLTGAEVIASGFFSSIGLARRVSRAQRQRIVALIDELGLHELSTRNALQLSYGEFRRILLARALVHEPQLLICDEPFDGLDAEARAKLARLLGDIARRGTSVVMVTHHRNDLPACITHVAELKSGAIVFRGTVAEFSSRFVRTRPAVTG